MWITAAILAFNEIHPDYYQIPVADREALKEALMEEENDDDDDEDKSHGKDRRRGQPEKTENAENLPLNGEQAPHQEDQENDESAEQIVETVSENENDEVMDRSRYRQIKKYKIQEVIFPKCFPAVPNCWFRSPKKNAATKARR